VKNLEDRIEALEKTVQQLETQIGRLRSIADTRKHPFTYLMLEYNITREQEEEIFKLMEHIRKEIFENKAPMNHANFEQMVYEIVPNRKGDYHFAENIVMCLNDTNQYPDVYLHMKKSGMNI
jgi:hypothetical protein